MYFLQNGGFLKNAIQDSTMEVPNLVIQVPNALIQVPGCSDAGPWMCRCVDAPPPKSENIRIKISYVIL